MPKITVDITDDHIIKLARRNAAMRILNPAHIDEDPQKYLTDALNNMAANGVEAMELQAIEAEKSRVKPENLADVEAADRVAQQEKDASRVKYLLAVQAAKAKPAALADAIPDPSLLTRAINWAKEQLGFDTKETK